MAETALAAHLADDPLALREEQIAYAIANAARAYVGRNRTVTIKHIVDTCAGLVAFLEIVEPLYGEAAAKMKEGVEAMVLDLQAGRRG